jgi:hypothetical protein
MTEKANLAASIAARLLNRARQTGADYQTLLTSYCLERFLYRLSVSDRSDRFVLKGAMLLRVWSDQPYRATRDKRTSGNRADATTPPQFLADSSSST